MRDEVSASVPGLDAKEKVFLSRYGDGAGTEVVEAELGEAVAEVAPRGVVAVGAQEEEDAGPFRAVASLQYTTAL